MRQRARRRCTGSFRGRQHPAARTHGRTGPRLRSKANGVSKGNLLKSRDDLARRRRVVKRRVAAA